MEKNVFPGWAYDTEFFEKKCSSKCFSKAFMCYDNALYIFSADLKLLIYKTNIFEINKVK